MMSRWHGGIEFLILVGMLLILQSDAFLSPRKGLHRRVESKPILRPLEIAKSGGKMILTEDMYTQNVLAKDVPRPVLVFFSAPWCGPCRLTNPVVKEVMKQYSGKIDVVEVCTDDLAEIAENAGIVSIPTIQFYYGGQLLETIVGCVAQSVLSAAVDKVLEDLEQQQKPR
mmetsp:Transcript_10311/g.29904  ORF Transcript_10311/g.29904 Transcript_10311/m.29904 type:complete len:170 (-) Transcript_10311:193-702(-)